MSWLREGYKGLKNRRCGCVKSYINWRHVPRHCTTSSSTRIPSLFLIDLLLLTHGCRRSPRGTWTCIRLEHARTCRVNGRANRGSGWPVMWSSRSALGLLVDDLLKGDESMQYPSFDERHPFANTCVCFRLPGIFTAGGAARACFVLVDAIDPTFPRGIRSSGSARCVRGHCVHAGARASAGNHRAID